MYKPNNLSILLFLISLFSLNSKREKSIITVPLKVVSNSYEKYPISEDAEYKIIKETKVKSLFGTKMRRLIEGNVSGRVEKLKCLLFAAPIYMYNNPTFNVILDTGSVNLWFADINNPNKNKSSIKNYYDPSRSQYSQKTNDKFEITYGTGYVNGTYYKDRCTSFFGFDFFTKFGVASSIEFDVEGADGIMGLAKKYTEDAFSAIWTLYNQNMLSSKSFSIKYFSEEKVEMYLGDEHEDFEDMNNTSTCQLLNRTTYDNLVWTCKLYSFGLISYDNKTKINASCGYNFLFDTGSNLMMLPMETLKHLENDLGKYNCYSAQGKNGYQILCEDINNLPHIFIEVGNYALFMHSKELYYKFFDESKDKYVYALNVYFLDTISISLVGQPFFKLFHTKFDFENKVLKFYSDQPGNKEFTWVKPPNDQARDFEPVGSDWLNENTYKIIAAICIVIAILFVLCVFINCCKKIMKCGKKNKGTAGRSNELSHL